MQHRLQIQNSNENLDDKDAKFYMSSFLYGQYTT